MEAGELLRQGDGELSSVDALFEFLEAFVHAVLYSRSIYPSAVFERRAKFGIPTFMSRHKGVNEWIVQSLRAAMPLVKSGCAEHIAVVLLSEAGEAIESQGVRVAAAVDQPLSDGDYEDVAQGFANCLLKLGATNAMLERPPDGTTFTIRVCAKQGEAAAVQTAMATGKWVTCDVREDPSFAALERATLPATAAVSTFIKSMSTRHLRIHVTRDRFQGDA